MSTRVPTRLRILLPLLLLAMAAPTASASGDGLPVINLDTSRVGVGSADGGTHFYALKRQDGTELLRTRTEVPGNSLDSLILNGTLAVPGVAWDATTSGLSADGATLVLIEPRKDFPRSATRFAVIDAERMKLRETFTLDGDYSFDALSPDGSSMYLIHYTNPRDPRRYEVRAYDLVAGKMQPDPVLDTRTAPVAMRGFPITRSTSPDGRWEYTLYDGGGGTPFVHALDTVAATSVCVNVDQLQGARNLFATRLAVSDDGSTITVGPPRKVKASIATGSWAVTDLTAATAPPPGPDGGGIPAWWALPGAALALLAVGTGIARRRAGRSGARAQTAT